MRNSFDAIQLKQSLDNLGVEHQALATFIHVSIPLFPKPKNTKEAIRYKMIQIQAERFALLLATS